MRALFLCSGSALVEFEREAASLAAELRELAVELPGSQSVNHLQAETLLPRQVETGWQVRLELALHFRVPANRLLDLEERWNSMLNTILNTMRGPERLFPGDKNGVVRAAG
jgi:hypothetical protein